MQSVAEVCTRLRVSNLCLGNYVPFDNGILNYLLIQNEDIRDKLTVFLKLAYLQENIN